MNIFDKAFREIFSAQMISICGGLIAGTVLAMYTNKIFIIPGMLILIPGFLETRGNISGTFASRLSSGLFLRIINPNKIKTKIIRDNILAASVLVIITSVFLGLIAFLFTYFVSHTVVFKILLIPILAGILANLIEIPLTLFATLYLFKKGHDPNNIMGPFITSTGDITSVVSILLVILLI